jgi:hypothetical protein
MIEVIGATGTPEHEAALLIKDAIIRHWPGIENTPASDDHIKIVAGVKLFGLKISDIDIVVAGLFSGRRYIIPRGSARDADGESLLGTKVRVRSFVAAIEVKDHPASRMEISAGGVNVEYKDGWKSATDQNDKQRHALRSYLQFTTGANPYVYRCVMLRGIDELPKHRGITQPEAGTISARFDASAFFMAMAMTAELRKRGGEYTIASADDETLQRILSCSLMVQLKASNLDRKRMVRIASRPEQAREIAGLLGNARVHIRGNGGTGKTVLMLQSAYEAFISKGTRSLLLTYNTALAADIQRTLALMGIPGDGETGGIRVRTVMSFMYSWLSRFGLAGDGDIDLEEYDARCAEALRYFSEGALTDEEVTKAMRAEPLELAFDAILIDEAQDWPQAEADLLARIYGPTRISLADGLSQLIRGEPTNWREQTVLIKGGEAPRSLREGLRMKASLCKFANAIADEAGLQWHVTPNSQASGGRIILALGNYAQLDDLQEAVLRDAIRDGNMPVDLLHCVPPSSIKALENMRRRSDLGKSFEAKTWELWDAVDPETRRTFPRSASSLRIVQYESCRGLEGWTTVLDGLDEFWDLKRLTTLSSDQALSGLIDPELHAHAVAWQWCMIPLTRPIDTLVITFRDANSQLARVVATVAARMPDIVETMY